MNPQVKEERFIRRRKEFYTAKQVRQHRNELIYRKTIVNVFQLSQRNKLTHTHIKQSFFKISVMIFGKLNTYYYQIHII